MWFRRVCSDGFRRVQTVQTVCSDDIVMGEVGLLELDWQQVGLLELVGISC